MEGNSRTILAEFERKPRQVNYKSPYLLETREVGKKRENHSFELGTKTTDRFSNGDQVAAACQRMRALENESG